MTDEDADVEGRTEEEESAEESGSASSDDESDEQPATPPPPIELPDRKTRGRRLRQVRRCWVLYAASASTALAATAANGPPPAHVDRSAAHGPSVLVSVGVRSRSAVRALRRGQGSAGEVDREVLWW